MYQSTYGNKLTMEFPFVQILTKRKTVTYFKVIFLFFLLLTPCSILLMSNREPTEEQQQTTSRKHEKFDTYINLDKIIYKIDKTLKILKEQVASIKVYGSEQLNRTQLQSNVKVLLNKDIDKPVRNLVKSGRIRGKFVQSEVYENKDTRTVKVLILIGSQGMTRHRREFIRKTWGHFSPLKTDQGQMQLNWKFLFVVGSPTDGKVTTEVFQENKVKQDMLLLNIMEFPMFSSWTVMAALEWIDTCMLYEYVLYMQDSMFLNVPALYNFIHDSGKPEKDLYAGVIDFEKTVPRKGLNAVKLKNYPNDLYPRHATRGAFIMTRDLVNKIASIFEWDNTFPDPDATIGRFVQQSGVDVWAVETLVANHTIGQCFYQFNAMLTDYYDDDSCKTYLYKESLNQIVSI